MRSSGTTKRALARIATAVTILLLAALPAHAGGGSPQLALVRATPFRSSTAATTLELEGSFNFEDTIQLPLPVSVIITQGTLTARFDLVGHVYTSVGGAPEQPGSGPGVIAVRPDHIRLVLPSGFAAGAASVQLLAPYQGDTFVSNTLGFAL